jgi:hypothetical protein
MKDGILSQLSAPDAGIPDLDPAFPTRRGQQAAQQERFLEF